MESTTRMSTTVIGYLSRELGMVGTGAAASAYRARASSQTQLKSFFGRA